MSYKIALASSDGTNIDVHFGAAGSFLIYEVSDEGAFSLLERRTYDGGDEAAGSAGCNPAPDGCGTASCGGQGKRAAGSPAELSEPEQGRQASEPGLPVSRPEPGRQALVPERGQPALPGSI